MRLPNGVNGDLGLRTRQYAVRIVRLYASLPKTTEAQVMGKQLLRAGTSVGAHIAESNRGKSPADFVNKIDGALQELDEAVYWMRLLVETEIVEPQMLDSLLDESEQIAAVLVTIARRTRRSMSAELGR